MALPYAYAKLGAHGKAANLYGQTIQTLEAELSQLDSAIKLAQNGELQQYLISVLETQQKNTYTQLLADKQKQPFYLHTLLTDVQFRLLVDSLRELVLSQQRLHQQQNKIDTLNKLATSKLKQIAASQSKTTKPVKHLKNQSKTYQQFGKQKKQLIKLSAQLKQIKNKLTPVLIEAGKQLSLLAENKLQQQHEKLESYRINALFALAESYDLATRQQ
jgi:NADH dehydrogenase/NADH:ubiquinone oxidoreductase subunit G